MSKFKQILSFTPVYILFLLVIICGTIFANKAVTTVAQTGRVSAYRTIIIDAGHGGVDGGATSCTGVLESNINLQFAIKLNDLFHLLGYHTVMIRTEDVSVYTEGETIAAKKVSDLKERVRIINSTKNAFLISIHQNYYPDAKYSGAQVFYAKTEDSQGFAGFLQNNLIKYLQSNPNRKPKKADGIYMMQHVKCPAVLVECGFISNQQEEQLLTDDDYQRKLCCVIAASCSTFLTRENMSS